MHDICLDSNNNQSCVDNMYTGAEFAAHSHAASGVQCVSQPPWCGVREVNFPCFIVFI